MIKNKNNNKGKMMKRNSFDDVDRKIGGENSFNRMSVASSLSTCNNCGGKKVIIIKIKGENQHIEEKSIKCPVCNGSGFTV